VLKIYLPLNFPQTGGFGFNFCISRQKRQSVGAAGDWAARCVTYMPGNNEHVVDTVLSVEKRGRPRRSLP